MKFNLHLLRLMVIPCAIVAISMVGCMSLEERLMSSDPSTRKSAEIELLNGAIASGDETMMLDAVEQVTFDELLAVVATNTNLTKNVVVQAVKQMQKEDCLAVVAA